MSAYFLKHHPNLNYQNLVVSLATGKLFLNQIVKTKAIPLSFDYARETALTPKAAAKLLQSLKEIENGEYTEYETVEEAIKAMSEEAHG